MENEDVKEKSVPSPKKTAVGFLLVFILLHMGMTVAYDWPSNKWADSDRRNTIVYDYMWPMFHQGYKLFAANPISSDRALYIQARVQNKQTQEITETEWLNFTAGEIGSFDQKLRRKHPSILGSEGYVGAWSPLTTAQKEIVQKDFPGKDGYQNLKAELNASNNNKNTGAVNNYMRNMYYINSLASQAGLALYADEDHDVVEIKTKVRYTTIPRWNERYDVNDKADWKFRDYETGWTRLLSYTGQNEQKFKETIEGWFK